MKQPGWARGPQALAAFVPDLVRDAFGRRGFAEARILTEWAEIVGPDLAAHSVPDRLAFPRKAADGATLHLTVSGGFATELQHLAPTVIERVNRFFGYRAVDRLKLTQGTVRPAAAPVRRPPAPKTDEVAGIDDDELRRALARLGGAIRARGERR